MTIKGERHDIPLEHVIEVYSDLLDDIWRRVAYFIGGITLQVLMRSAIRRTAVVYPFIANVTVTVDGISLHCLKDICRDIPKREPTKALQNLVTELFGLLASMSGDVIIRELTPIVKGAEEKLKHPGKEGE